MPVLRRILGDVFRAVLSTTASGPPLVASIRTRTRKDGTSSHSVLFTIDGRQTSVTFDDLPTAEKWNLAWWYVARRAV